MWQRPADRHNPSVNGPFGVFWLPFLTVYLLSLPTGLAQSDSSSILHEFFVPGYYEPAPEPLSDPNLSPEPNPSELVYSSAEHQPEPQNSLEQGSSSESHGRSFGSDTQVLDRDTQEEDWLDYFATFDPSVAPYKRSMAYDLVVIERGEIVLRVDDSQLSPIALSSPLPPADHERFWGGILLELSPEVYVPIPSVAPQMKIHRYATSPPIRLQFYRDRSDNVYARADSHQGLLRLNYLVSAPSRYFGGELPSEVYLGDLPRELRPQVPTEVLPSAREVFERLSLSREMSMSQVVELLTAYFRDFRAEPFPHDERSEDLYRDIALGRLGVCRHRSFAFVVTAQAWGIPSRYVTNEAHAFVEVYFPHHGWRRIDLGGAAAGLLVHNAQSRVLHTPVGGDPLPEPSGYEETYSRRMRESMSEQLASSAGAELAADTAGLGEAEIVNGRASDARQASSRVEVATGLPREPEMSALVREAARPGDRRARTRLELSQAPSRGYRGEPMTLRGTVLDVAGQGVGGLPVWVVLGPPSYSRSGQATSVGLLYSDDDGLLEGQVLIPQSLSLGDWGIYLVFEGDSELAPARSNTRQHTLDQ